MRVLLPILLLCGLAMGCGVDVKPDVLAANGTPDIQFSDPPDYAPATRFGLIRKGSTLQVGDNAEKGLSIFERPEKASSVSDLPDGWPKGYRSRGWQTDSESFGMVLRGEEIVAAMVTEEDVSEKRVTEIESDYTRFLGAPSETLQSPNVRYWIWEEAPYRCVICATKNAKAQLVVTVGTGFTQIMDALGLSHEGARSDGQKAEKILSGQTGG